MRRILRGCRCLVWGMMYVSVYACISTPTPADKEASAREIQIFGKFLVKMKHFWEVVTPLMQETELLRSHPGWGDMVPIIKAEPSIKHLEGDVVAGIKINAAIREWSEKWGAPGQVIYGEYHRLVAATRLVENERESLLNDLFLVYYLCPIRDAQGSVVSRNDYRDQLYRCGLNSFSIDSVGLYTSVDVGKIRLRCLDESRRFQQ